MAYIRVPIPVQTVVAQASKNGYIMYRCSRCGKDSLADYVNNVAVSEDHGIFQSAEKKAQIYNNVNNRAQALIRKKDEDMFRGFNIEHDYSVCEKRIVCPFCREIQIWSTVPARFKKSNFFHWWGILLACMAMGALFGLALLAADKEIVGLLLFIPLIAVALIPVIWQMSAAKKEKQVADASFEPPIYCNSYNINELISNPLFLMLLNEKLGNNNTFNQN